MKHCIDCAHWNARETDKALVKLGFAWCMTKHPLHTVRAYAVPCPKFEDIGEEKAKARREWLDKKKG